ncbi:uncharacterized protein [Nicotiana tomentosiformis]|uniref:uncharacterized protein isoform X2 n=1 Tax=Nicotiana tomentosiformis TaxID=4098 RepID=UPI00051C360D|nr:uncharacterized protein LOC104090474 isoform X2 [Nicotiana tomentosiformis]
MIERSGIIRLKGWQQAAVAVGSAVGALLDPRRADLIAALGETTGKPAFDRVLERMKKSPEGRIHTKKRNRLTLKRLHNLVFIKYNRALRRRYNHRNLIDPILLDNIDEANEWLTGVPENCEDEEVFEGDSNFTWGDVAVASGVGENPYGLRGNTSSSSSIRKEKSVATTSRSLSLIDEDESDHEEEEEGEEEDDE